MGDQELKAPLMSQVKSWSVEQKDTGEVLILVSAGFRANIQTVRMGLLNLKSRAVTKQQELTKRILTEAAAFPSESIPHSPRDR